MILVDDGIATGATVRVAILALREKQPAGIVVATPVAAAVTCQKLQNEVDDMVALIVPEKLGAIGEWYDDFSQISDNEVIQIIQKLSF